jgi:hypothetical protein
LTDRREPPRIETGDGPTFDVGPDDPARPASRRFARFVPVPVAKRLAVGKLGRVALIAVVGLALLLLAGSSLSRSLVSWLHARDEYQVRIEDIEIVPPVPPWIRGGREALLRAVFPGRSPLESISSLDVRLDESLKAFRLDPWIAGADRAERAFPNKLRFFVSYREPVAWIRADHQAETSYAVDRESKVLPREEIDEDHAEIPIVIIADKPGSKPRPGIDWPEAVESGIKPGSDRRVTVAEAAELATSLRAGMRRDRDVPGLPGSAFIFANEYANEYPKGLLVRFEGKVHVYWGDSDRRKSPSEPTDAEKWAILTAEIRGSAGRAVAKPNEYLIFRNGKVEAVPFKH